MPLQRAIHKREAGLVLSETEMRALVRICHEAGHLKTSKRTGWWIAGIRDPESIAEHSWRTAVIGYFLALAEGADPERTATICVFHDLAESRTGDIPSVGKHYLAAASPEDIARDQSQGLPDQFRDALQGLVGMTHGTGSPEAACARDADKIECLLQAREYQREGHPDVQEWIDSMVTAVRTSTGKAMAAAAVDADPGEWWRDMASSYGAKLADWEP